jgi:hypothetical protein
MSGSQEHLLCRNGGARQHVAKSASGRCTLALTPHLLPDQVGDVRCLSARVELDESSSQCARGPTEHALELGDDRVQLYARRSAGARVVRERGIDIEGPAVDGNEHTC